MVRIRARETLVNIGADRLSRLAAVIAVAGSIGAWPHPAAAQQTQARFDIGVQVSSAVSSQFDRTDIGLGGRFSWHPIDLLGVESEVTVYPGEFPNGVPFSRGRVEGLFGVTAGPRLNRVRPFARLRAGFLNVREAPEPIACILIFPPPLSCQLASGRTLAALDIGGGVEVSATPRLFVRVDAGDRLLKYPGPAYDNRRTVRDRAFFSHDFRFAAGAGVRF